MSRASIQAHSQIDFERLHTCIFHLKPVGNALTENTRYPHQITHTGHHFIVIPCLGLKLKLNVQQEEYVGYLTEPAGVRIAIHDQNTMPFPEDSGLYAQVGKLTSFSLIKVNS
jgi:hypothetical protein